MPDNTNDINTFAVNEVEEDIIVNDLVDSIKIALINEQSILPIIGFDLIPIKAGNKHVPYLDFLAGKIAADKNLVLDNTLYGFDLFNHLSHQLLVLNQFDKLETTKQISNYAKDIHNQVDKSYLEKIVGIFPFKYYLNLTFTTHLSEVIQQNRTFPKIAVNESSFPFQLKNPKKPDDLKKNECGFVATVYNLYGVAYQKGNIRFNFYYSDDDMLSFISEFNKRFDVDLKNYNEVIRSSSLLFLGCQYPDWLLRVLINTLAPGALDSRNSMQTRVFVDYCNDSATIFFLNKHKLQFQRNLQTQFFVNNLHRVLAENRFAVNINKNTDFVFVSYSRDNLDKVQKIICQLSFQMNIWFDRIKMFPGDLINDEVKQAIDNCKLFLPVITEESIGKPGTAYVKQEWIYYHNKFKNKSKSIPLVHNKVNLGELGFNISENFSLPGANLYHILFDENGLTEDDIDHIKNRL